MKTCQCRAPAQTLRRFIPETLAWLAPGALLLLIPKCPVCLAGYLALLTGAGISVSAASGFRTGLITICCLMLVWLALRRFAALRRPATDTEETLG